MPPDPTTPLVQFKLIDGFPNHRVGDDGSIWSRAKRGGYGGVSVTWRRLKGTRQHSGYLRVCLVRKRYTFVHRLVLEAFRGPCPAGEVCRHLDGDPSNNRLDNLKWGTPQENAHDRIRHGTSLRGERHSLAKLTEDLVKRIIAERRRSNRGCIEIARVLGIPWAMRGAVSGVIHGATWNHVTGLPPYKNRTRS